MHRGLLECLMNVLKNVQADMFYKVTTVNLVMLTKIILSITNPLLPTAANYIID